MTISAPIQINHFVSDPSIGWSDTINAILMPSKQNLDLKVAKDDAHVYIKFSMPKAILLTGLNLVVGLASLAMGIGIIALMVLPPASVTVAAVAVLVLAGCSLAAGGYFMVSVGKGLALLCQSNRDYKISV